VGEREQVFAEAEAADALLERSAAAAKEALEKGFEFEGAGDVAIDFGDFFGSEFSPARADGSVFPEAGEEELDLGEGKAHVAGEADQKSAMEGFAGIAALAADALWRGEKTESFVVADGGSVEASAAGEFTDFHVSFPWSKSA
jgi:hypothetical protein